MQLSVSSLEHASAFIVADDWSQNVWDGADSLLTIINYFERLKIFTRTNFQESFRSKKVKRSYFDIFLSIKNSLENWRCNQASFFWVGDP